MKSLRDLRPGEGGQIVEVGGAGAVRRHLLNMGVIPGTPVKVTGLAPMGDPMEILIHNYSLTIRLDEAAAIQVREGVVETEEMPPIAPVIANVALHPGLGEEGRYHNPEQVPLPENTLLTFALVGNQNCGKTTLFNQLTGSKQHVGNFPGVTVARKDGAIRHYDHTLITDLPGIYSMSPFSAEELVTREFVLKEHPKCIINIVDATNMVRNLNLTIQLMELDIPMVLAVNMMDELTSNGGAVLVNKMEDLLGIPVVPISAASGDGIEELIHHAIHIARYQERPKRHDFCDARENCGAVHRAIHSIHHLIEDHAAAADIPPRFAASKIIEGDAELLRELKLEQNELEMLEHIVLQMEKERGLDRAAAIADMHFSFIRSLCSKALVTPRESRERIRSRRMDKVLTGKYTAIPCFAAIMALVFYLTFDLIGPVFQEWLEDGITFCGDSLLRLMDHYGVNETLKSLIEDGIFASVGCVLSFLPLIIILFFFLSMLEDSGYIARVAFVMDKILRKIGLSGRSIVPMLIGFGCTVPAVMATRTLPSARDRKMTILLTPFMSCTAKLPIYAFFVNAFFPEYRGLIITGLYFLGIICGVIIAELFKKVLFRGEAMPFVMELPNYRWPGFRNVRQLLWEKTADFLQRAFTVIFAASLLVWFLQTFTLRLQLAAVQQTSILASLAGVLSPLFAPLGLGDWRICVSLITGVMAKESVVSTLNILLEGNVGAVLTPLAAVSLLVFSLLYTPCVAAIAAIRRELGWRWAALLVVWQCLLAWVIAWLVRELFILCGWLG